MDLDKYLPKIQKNVSLAEYTTFRIGGKASYFLTVQTKEELFEAISFAHKLKLSFFILGGGSNLLVSDKGYKGLVIKIQMNNFFVSPLEKIFAEAGAKLSDLVKISFKKGLTGMEWASGIPGATVGGRFTAMLADSANP